MATLKNKNKSRVKWGNKQPPVIQHIGLPLARPTWNLRPTSGSPMATKPNWEMVKGDENNSSPRVGQQNVPYA